MTDYEGEFGDEDELLDDEPLADESTEAEAEDEDDAGVERKINLDPEDAEAEARQRAVAKADELQREWDEVSDAPQHPGEYTGPPDEASEAVYSAKLQAWADHWNADQAERLAEREKIEALWEQQSAEADGDYEEPVTVN